MEGQPLLPPIDIDLEPVEEKLTAFGRCAIKRHALDQMRCMLRTLMPAISAASIQVIYISFQNYIL